MREYKLGKGSVTLPIQSTGRITVRASSKTPLTLLGVCGTEKVPLARGENIDFKETLSADFSAVELTVHGTGSFGYSFQEHLMRSSDPVDDRAPPAPPEPTATNLVAQFRRLVQQTARAGRTTMEPDDDNPYFQRYFVDDDDFTFEEDIFSQQSEPQSPGKPAVAGAVEAEIPTPPAGKPSEAPSKEEPPSMAAE